MDFSKKKVSYIFLDKSVLLSLAIHESVQLDSVFEDLGIWPVVLFGVLEHETQIGSQLGHVGVLFANNLGADLRQRYRILNLAVVVQVATS